MNIPRYSNQEIRLKITEYLSSKQLLIENLIDTLAKLNYESVAIYEHTDRNHKEMYLCLDGYVVPDSAKCKGKIITQYGMCFKVSPNTQVGPEIILEDSMAKIYKFFGYNRCDKHYYPLYTELDTSILKSRFPKLPFYNKESQPSDTECSLIWQINEYWYMVTN